MADAIFEETRLAEIYDPLDPDRGDLDVYVAMVEEFGARSVLDVGCGTGTLATLLARRGLEVTAVDPARASLEVARRKPDAAAVRWIEGDARAVPPLQADMATMTGNVAQVFLTDGDWRSTLEAVRDRLRPGGRLVFETRDPSRRAWRQWDRPGTYRRHELSGVGVVESWSELVAVDLPLVSFRWTVLFEADGAVMTSDSTLRFRGRNEVVDTLQEVGFTVEDIRDAPDRPGLEFVFIARR